MNRDFIQIGSCGSAPQEKHHNEEGKKKIARILVQLAAITYCYIMILKQYRTELE